MKTLIIALNSKYIHSSLAPWYLKASCSNKCGEVKVMEFTINENPDSVLASIYSENADVTAFSCYIWNIGIVLRLAESLKKILPDLTIVFGGPEVSYDAEEVLQKYPFAGFVISGEGEKAFSELLECVSAKTPDKLKAIKGLTYREGSSSVVSVPQDVPHDLSTIPSPYTREMLAAAKDKIIYFEASRGCPFSCSYCLSAADDGVRFFPLEGVKKELAKIMKTGVRQVKFVDRTFNCNKERAKEILRFIYAMTSAEGKCTASGTYSQTNFHFEAAADLFDDELLNMLANMPKGLIQLEIGIQTTNLEAMEEVKRKTDINKAFENIRKILKEGNIHVHLDLIAGLPYEDFESFKDSFNKVYSLKPHTLQLGFLKLLKGSPIRKDAKKHGCLFRDYAPYEVLSNKYISFYELTVLKGIEELVDRFWNSGRFTAAIDYIIDNYFLSAFDFYLGFYNFNIRNKRNIQSVALRDLYLLLLEYSESIEGIDKVMLRDLLKLDFLASDSSGHLPAGFSSIIPFGFKDKCFEFLKDESNLTIYLTSFAGLPAKQIMKNVHFEYLNGSVCLFDYSGKDAVTGRYKFHIIDI